MFKMYFFKLATGSRRTYQDFKNVTNNKMPFFNVHVFPVTADNMCIQKVAECKDYCRCRYILVLCLKWRAVILYLRNMECNLYLTYMNISMAHPSNEIPT